MHFLKDSSGVCALRMTFGNKSVCDAGALLLVERIYEPMAYAFSQLYDIMYK